MFERFTERARQVIVLAQDEARALRHGYVGTERLLLGLVVEGEGVANRVMARLGAPGEAVRRELGGMLGPHASFGGGEEFEDRVTSKWLRLDPPRRSAPASFPVGLVAGAAVFAAGLLVGWAIWG